MGVKGLWRLLLPIGRRVSIETLSGQILAVDASIWLTQFIKAMRDPTTGKVTAAAHLIGFFRRLCKLRFHNIKPVFVFDGATPEIKRREIQLRKKRKEQFATLSDGSVQRLAKRLLAETLKKKAKLIQEQNLQNATTVASGGGGAAIAGFNLTDNTTKSSTKIITNNEKDKNTNVDSEAKLPAEEGDGDNDVEVLGVLSPDNNNTKKDENVSDWDLPLAVAAAEEAKELEQEEQDQISDNNESDVEYEDYNPISNNRQRRNNRKINNYYSKKDNEFSVEYVASLSAIERKEAIENAQKKQRLQSRKEFMPAAANPDNFSSVQLKNFLKHCHLNKQIHKIAKTASNNNDNVMASDRTTRVELIRENDDDNTIQQQQQEKQKQQSRRNDNSSETKRPRRLVAMAKSSSYDRYDDDYDDDDDDDVSFESSPKRPGNSRQFIEDDDDDDDNERAKEINGESGEYSKETTRNKIVNAPTAASGLLHYDMSDDDDIGGGFLPTDSNPSVEKNNDRKGNGKNMDEDMLDTKPPARTDSLSRNAHSNNIGMVKQVQRIPGLLIHNDSEEESDDGGGGGGFLRDDQKTIDIVEKTNQEDCDRAIALALQEEEDTATLFATGDSTHDGNNLNSSEKSKPTKGNIERANDSNLSPSDQKIVDVADSSDEDDVNWEDGETDKEDEKCQPQENAAIDCLPKKNGTLASDEDSVAWEDGENRDDESEMEVSKEKSFDDFGQMNRSETAATSPDKFAKLKADAEKSVTAETSAAWVQAQATASNLTNWAGRAFRRAMREVGGTDEVNVETVDDSDSSDNENYPIDLPQQDKVVQKAQRDKHEGKSVNEKIGTPENTPAETSEGQTSSYFDAVDFIAENEAEWAAERNRRERDLDAVSDEMLLEAKQLLQLFGVPYCEAPAEAEAQCAALEELGLVSGIITEDSDVFVFGGKIVYKNIFDEQKYVEVYKAEDAEREMNLGRNSMVALAMLLGGDYTEGVKGVGIVNAMEVLQTFDVSVDLKEGLTSFKKWLDGFDPADALALKSTEHCIRTKEQLFHSKHRAARNRWIAPSNFPADNVIKAYIDPVVDKSREKFSWGVPDVDNLVVFCSRNIGWQPEETKQLLEPTLNAARGGLRQTRIDSFMKYEDAIKFADVRSKRLREVLGLKPDGTAIDKVPKRRKTK